MLITRNFTTHSLFIKKIPYKKCFYLKISRKWFKIGVSKFFCFMIGSYTYNISGNDKIKSVILFHKLRCVQVLPGHVQVKFAAL